MELVRETASLPHRRRLAEQPLLMVGMVLIAILALIRIAYILPERIGESDFNHTYSSSRLLLDGRDPYTAALAPFEGQLVNETNPPPLQWLFVPLALLPVRAAFWMWVGIQALSLGVILWLARKLLNGQLTTRAWVFIGVASLVSETVYAHFFYSQIQLSLAALVLAAYWHHRQGNHTTACLLVVLAGLVKVTPLMFLPWFIWRSSDNLRARLIRGVIMAVLTALGVWATGLSYWQEWRQALAVVKQGALGHFVFSVPVAIPNFVAAVLGNQLTPALMQTWWSVGAIAGLGLLALAFGRCWLASNEEAEFCLLSVAMLAGGVSVRGYYFVWLIFPMIALLARLVARPALGPVIGYLILLVLLNDLNGWMPAALRTRPIGSLIFEYAAFYGLLLLGFFFWKECRGTRRAF